MSLYKGEIKDGTKNGFGIQYNKSKDIVYKGNWKDNNYHGWGCLFNHNYSQEGKIDY